MGIIAAGRAFYRPMAPPEVRAGAMIEGITYLETIGAAIMASPAWRWPEPAWIVRTTGHAIELSLGK